MLGTRANTTENFSKQNKELGQALLSVPFDFKSLTKESLQSIMQNVIKLIHSTYDEIASLKSVISFATAIQPLINLETYITKAKRLCTFAKEIHTDKNIREISLSLTEDLGRAEIDSNQREDVFNIFQAYEKNNYLTEKTNLSAEQNRYFKQLMNTYKRNGLHITDPLIKARITFLRKEIAQLGNKFSENISNENMRFVFSKTELAGLPEGWFTQERRAEQDKYTATLKYPDYFPIMEFVKNRNVRKQVYLAFNSRCADSNLPILTRIVQCRQELASLLGYKNYVDFMLELRAIKTSQNLHTFLHEMQELFTPLFHERLQQLTLLAREIEKDGNFNIESYDVAYYNRLLIEKELDLNIEELNSYFSLDKVIQGTFTIYENLLGLKFIEKENFPKWHSDIKQFEVYNFNHATQERGDKLGVFYFDLHPRDGKYSHAAIFDLLPGSDIASLNLNKDEYGALLAGETLDFTQQRQLPVAVMVCNFPKEEHLSFDPDVTTFFHEFGHIMHYFCALQKVPALNAFFTEIDFVEAPSQMLENWCYDKNVLKLLSAHPETHESIPETLINKVKLIRKSKELLENVRQLVLSNFDITIHSLSAKEAKELDVKTCYEQIQKQIRRPLSQVSNECFASAFGHIAGEYAVGYYGYMLTVAYAADMFDTKFRENPLSSVRGAEYRKCILEPGSTQDGMDLLKNFLGREPNFNAYYENFGVKKSVKTQKESLIQKLSAIQSSEQKDDKENQTATSLRDIPSLRA